MSPVRVAWSPSRKIRCVHVIVPEPEGSVGGADMHVRDLATAQLDDGATTPTVFETLSPSYAAKLRFTGVDCVSVAGRGRRAILPTLRRLIADRQVNLVHAHGYDATWWSLGALALSRPRPALVVTCHGWIETTAVLKVMSALDRAANRFAAGVIVVSDELIAPALRSSTRARVFASIPNGVPIRPPVERTDTRLQLGLPAGRPLVGAMGRLSREKRHDMFVSACAMVAGQRPDVHFVLAGGGPLRAVLERQVTDSRLSDRLHVVGVVDEPDQLLRELDVLVQPSDVETTSRVVMEAMVQGRPVIATRVGGIQRLIQDGVDGVLVPPGSPDAMATEILRLLRRPQTAADMGVAARRTAVARFGVDDMAAAVDDVYIAVLGGKPMRPGTWVRSKGGDEALARRPKH